MSREDNLPEESREAIRIGRLKGNQSKIDRAIRKRFCKGSSTSNLNIKKWLLFQLHWDYRCSSCGLTEWKGKSLSLELDHIDGDSSNNELTNLRFLCPNCHSQTESFRGKNINLGIKKVSDDDLRRALGQAKSIRAALLQVGLAPKGANYSRAYKLMIPETKV